MNVRKPIPVNIEREFYKNQVSKSSSDRFRRVVTWELDSDSFMGRSKRIASIFSYPFSPKYPVPSILLNVLIL